MPYLWPFLHLQILWAKCSPWWFFLNGPGLIGAVLPGLISLWIVQRDVRMRLRKPATVHWPLIRLLLGFCGADIVLENALSFWTHGSLTLFPASEVVWPILALLLAPEDFPRLLAYPLTYLNALFVDLFQGGTHFHWNAPLWWIGVGGAGVRDGLFVTPLVALALTYAVGAIGVSLRRKGCFAQDVGFS